MILADKLKDSLVLAPLTKGGNLPFRRLCAEFGAPITFSEMAYARFVSRGEGRELALLRRHHSENCFGVQLAAKAIDEGVKAAQVAVDRGADFIDINCGCPIHDTVRRGLGAHLLRKPAALGKFIAGLSAAISVPVTVKIRTGWENDNINVLEVSRILEESGAAAITVHGRTREQRYTRSADWSLIGEVAAARKIPVIGNGDILTYFEAANRKAQSGCAALMIGRGALIKPWIFKEILSGQAYEPTSEERVEIYWKLASYMKEHFRDDEKGFNRAMFFLPWHFSFLCRYRPFPADRFEAASKEQPLIQTRVIEFDESTPLSKLLKSESEEIHSRIAVALWKSAASAEAVTRLTELSVEAGDELNKLENSRSADTAEYQG